MEALGRHPVKCLADSSDSRRNDAYRSPARIVAWADVAADRWL